MFGKVILCNDNVIGERAIWTANLLSILRVNNNQIGKWIELVGFDSNIFNNVTPDIYATSSHHIDG